MKLLCPLIAALLCSMGLAQAPRAEILWDTYGVPHIYAQTDKDLYYAWGWAQMRANANTLLEVIGRARGKAAEYWGEAYLASDRYMHQMGMLRKVAAYHDQPEQEPTGEFVAGMNAYLAAHRSTVEPRLTQVLPITQTDILALSLYDAYYDGNYVSPDIIQELRDQFLKSGTAQDPSPTPTARASNAWAIGPSKSSNGHALLLANPHIPWPTLKGLEGFRWLETHLVMPGLDFYGTGLIGTPVLNIGFNQNLGWTITAAPTFDFIDTYLLTLKDGGYVFDGQVKSFEARRTPLKVRLSDGGFREEVVETRFSIHGPLIAQKGDKAIAVAFVVPSREEFTAKPMWDMVRAKNLAEFKQALEPQTILASNILYADREGNIYYALAGMFPKRPAGNYDWSGTLPGDTSATLWQGKLPFSAMPTLLNPTTGYLQSANEPPYFATMPSGLDPTKFPSDFPKPILWPRTQRSLQLLSSQEKFSVQDVMRLKFDTHSGLADRVLPMVIALGKQFGSPEAQEVVKLLESWDRNFEAGSPGALVFAFWAMSYDQNILSGKRFPADAFAVPYDANRPLETPMNLKDPQKAIAGLEFAARAVKQTFGSLQVPWGAFYTFKADEVSMPAFGAPPESFGVFSPTIAAPQQGGPLAAIVGDSWVAVLEFSTPIKAMAILPYGNVSPQSGLKVEDQLKPYASKQYRPVWFNRSEVEAHLILKEVMGR